MSKYSEAVKKLVEAKLTPKQVTAIEDFVFYMVEDVEDQINKLEDRIEKLNNAISNFGSSI